jgi:hypothetical protein
MRRLVLVIILLSAKYIASAQTWEVGGFLGGAGYMGDINPVKAYKLTDPAFGVQIKRNFDGYWSAKLNYMYGKVRASDAASSNSYQIERNLDFILLCRSYPCRLNSICSDIWQEQILVMRPES